MQSRYQYLSASYAELKILHSLSLYDAVHSPRETFPFIVLYSFGSYPCLPGLILLAQDFDSFASFPRCAFAEALHHHLTHSSWPNFTTSRRPRTKTLTPRKTSNSTLPPTATRSPATPPPPKRSTAAPSAAQATKHRRTPAMALLKGSCRQEADTAGRASAGGWASRAGCAQAGWPHSGRRGTTESRRCWRSLA